MSSHAKRSKSVLVEVGGVRSASTVARAARRLVVAGTPTRREQAGCAVTKRSDATTDLDIGDLRGFCRLHARYSGVPGARPGTAWRTVLWVVSHVRGRPWVVSGGRSKHLGRHRTRSWPKSTFSSRCAPRQSYTLLSRPRFRCDLLPPPHFHRKYGCPNEKDFDFWGMGDHGQNFI